MSALFRTLRFFIWFGAVVLAGSTAFAVWSTLTMRDRHLEGASLTEPVDVVIVLGAGLDPDGWLAYSSRRRVYAAVRLLRTGKTRAVIFSGSGWEGEGVGALMRDLAITVGAPPEKLFAENRSVSTFQNLLFSFPIADRAGFERIALVSDSFHLQRAATLSAFFGRPDVGLVAARGFDDMRPAQQIGPILREALSWWLNFLRMIGWQLLEAAGYTLEERTALIR